MYSEVVLRNVPLRYISVPQPPTPVSLSEHLTNDLLARIGVNGFENPMRDSKVTEFKSQVYIPTHPKCNTIYMYLDMFQSTKVHLCILRYIHHHHHHHHHDCHNNNHHQIGAGCKLKMDDSGNILVKRVKCNSSILDVDDHHDVDCHCDH